MTFGVQCDEAQSRAILDRASDYGVSFIDTADGCHQMHCHDRSESMGSGHQPAAHSLPAARSEADNVGR
jgi:hypothetical protein